MPIKQKIFKLYISFVLSSSQKPEVLEITEAFHFSFDFAASL